MIDIHSHILPNFDDGAKDIEESLEMLRESKRQGVTRVISTSHCYPKSRNSIKNFLCDRNKKLEILRKAIADSGEDLPEIYAGCELNICRDFTEDKGLEDLCIEGTNYILLEMPYEPWTQDVIEVVYKVMIKGMRPIIAHIDRFLYQDSSKLDALYELGVNYQVNAEAFLNKKMLKQVDKLFSDGHAEFIGSDMHNMTDRRPVMNVAKNKIIAYFGESYWNYLQSNNSLILKNDELNPFSYKKLVKKSFFERIFSKKISKNP